MPPGRDPLAVKYDRTTAHVLKVAAAAYRESPSKSRPLAAREWVHTPAAEYRNLDRGGRTRSERAFTRSIYHQATRADPREWSVRLEWGSMQRRGSRYGRWVRVRVFRYRAGLRHSEQHPRRSYIQRPELRSVPGNRIGDRN